MAENLRYKLSTEGSLCRDDDDSDCSKYGRFYDRYVAGNENICPDGWTVPSETDYENLVKALGGDYDKLKSQTVWEDEEGNNFSFSNESGFNALPVGFLANSGSPIDDGYAAHFRTTGSKSLILRTVNIFYYEGTAYPNNSGLINSSYPYGSVRCIMKENIK